MFSRAPASSLPLQVDLAAGQDSQPPARLPPQHRLRSETKRWSRVATCTALPADAALASEPLAIAITSLAVGSIGTLLLVRLVHTITPQPSGSSEIKHLTAAVLQVALKASFCTELHRLLQQAGLNLCAALTAKGRKLIACITTSYCCNSI